MMNRICVGVLMTVLLVPLAAFAQTSTTGAAEADLTSTKTTDMQRGPTGRNAAIAVLQKRVDSIDWPDVTFEYVIDWIREQGAVNVIANWTALGVEAVDTEREINLRLRNTTVAEILNETVDQLSETGSVRFRAMGNTIRISTEQDFNRKLHVRVYNVTDILFRVPDFDDAPEIDLQRQQGGSGGGGGGGQTVFSGGSSGGGDERQEDEQEVKQRLDEIRKLIEESIAPETWDANGGKGTIRAYNRQLVVNNSIEVHEQIAGLFTFGE